MKKLLAIGLMVAMFLSLGISAFAAGGGFVMSPSKQTAPQLIMCIGKNESGEVEVNISITAFGDRDKLHEDARQIMEDAYTAIIETPNVVDLNNVVKAAIENILAKMNKIIADENEGKAADQVKAENLAISDFFDISDAATSGANNYSLTIKPETLKNFVCLLHYCDGDWHVVENAKVSENGEHLEFSVDSFSPFAIVVDTAAVEVEPQVDNNNVRIIAICAVVAGLVLGGVAIVTVIQLKKRKI